MKRNLNTDSQNAHMQKSRSCDNDGLHMDPAGLRMDTARPCGNPSPAVTEHCDDKLTQACPFKTHDQTYEKQAT